MTILKTNNSGVFVQLQAGKASHYLGECVDLDSIPNPRVGGIDPIYCFNPRGDGYVEKGTKISPPGRIEYAVSELLEISASWLDQVKCPFNLYALWTTCGERGVFKNWERGAVVANNSILDDTISNVAHHTDSTEAMQERNLSGAIPRMDVWPLAAGRRTTTETRALNAIATCGNLFCGDTCGAQTLPGDDLVAVSDGSAASSFTDGKADVLTSSDKGVTWTATAADPFGVNESLLGVACFEIAKGTNRYLAVRGSVAGEALKVAYSDDGGATWNVVTVGATNTETIGGHRGLFVLDGQHLWLATTEGNIFFSTDGGESWSDQGADSVSGGAQLNAIHFVDAETGYAVGASDTILKTTDGGAHWTAATATGTGSDLLSVWTFSLQRVLVGTEIDGTNGSLHMSFNGTTTWEAKTFVGRLTESVNDIYFVNGLRGVIVTNTAGPVGSIHETIDGGHEWRELTLPTNAGLNAVVMAEMNTAFAVGEVESATPVILGLGAY